MLGPKTDDAIAQVIKDNSLVLGLMACSAFFTGTVILMLYIKSLGWLK